MKTSFMLLFILLTATISSRCQPDLPPRLRSAVYRIEQPGVKQGTGVMFQHAEHKFLITNRHVVEDSDRRVCDSLFVYLNEIRNNNEVVSTANRVTVHLRIDDKEHFLICAQAQTDLVLILLQQSNTEGVDERDTLWSLKDYVILSDEALFRILKPNAIITFVGFPSKRAPANSVSVCPEYRWGFFLGADSLYLKSSAPVIHGNSGSPGFALTQEGYYFVGIATRVDNGICLAIPSSRIKTCFDRFFKLIDGT